MAHMLRSTAVTRINDGLGFRPAGNALEPKIIERLKEAQKDLEHGKTLPKFLLQEDDALTLLVGTNSIALPTGFLRLDEDNMPYFYSPDTLRAVSLRKAVSYQQALLWGASSSLETRSAPSMFVLRNTVIDFITTADRQYDIVWSYYKAAEVLDSEITNAWLEDDSASMWLIGEAGYRIAMDARDAEAIGMFDKLRTQGRAACFGEILASEDSGGPIVMGANL